MNTKHDVNDLFHASTPALAAWANAQLTPEMREMLPLLPAHKRPYVEEVEMLCPEHGPYTAKRFGYGKYAQPDQTCAVSEQAATNVSDEALASKAAYEQSRQPSMFKKARWGANHCTTTKCPACVAAKQRAEQAEAPAAEAPPVTTTVNLPPRYRDKTVSDFHTGIQANAASRDAQQKKAVRDQCLQYIRLFDDPHHGALSHGNTLMLLGASGTGKTHLACAIAKGVASKGYQAQYVMMSDMIRSVTDIWRQGSNSELTEAAVYDQYEAPDLLLIDDVTTMGITQLNNRIFCEMLDRRYRNMKPTVMVSTRHEKELRQAFGTSLLAGGDIARFDWRVAMD